MRTQEIKFLMIPDEVCQVIRFDNTLPESIEEIDDKVTCICFIGDTQEHLKDLYKLSEDIKSKGLKTAWFNNRGVIPFGAKYFNYIRISDSELYLNVSSGNSIRYSEISKYLIKDKNLLNPMDLYYFEMFDELSSK